MNIFFLDTDPYKAALALCDKHVPKMLLESCQMLSTAVQANAKKEFDDLYKPAYPKHPMTIWVGHTRQNFIWALENAVYIIINMNNDLIKSINHFVLLSNL